VTDGIVDDPSESQRGATDPTASVWVAASAGTGKTKVLTDRVLRLLLTGTAPERILCLTFTKAAAAEMNIRLARELGKWAAVDEEGLVAGLVTLLGRQPDDEQRRLARRLFARVLDTPGGMTIVTLHAFCQSLLGRFPIEAGVAPHFAVVDERDQRELLRAARDEMLTAARRDTHLAEALGEITRHLNEAGFADLLAALTADRSRLQRFLHRQGENAAAAVRSALGVADGETADGILLAACTDDAFDGAGLRRVIDTLAQGSKTDIERAAAIAAWVALDPDGRAAGFADYAAAFLTEDDHLPRPKQRLLTNGVSKKAPWAQEVLEAEAERLRRTELRRRAAAIAAATTALVEVGADLLRRYERLKNGRALLDFEDLITKTADLLESDGGASWVLFKLDGGIDHVLIDEAQDTSPEQWRIVRALAGEFFVGEGGRREDRTVFAVGDVKQSIFSFQGADPQAFLDSRAWFGARIAAAGHTWRPLDLSVSFRSTRAVLAAVDAVFARPEAAAGVVFDGQDIEHRAWRQRAGGVVEVWPAIEPRTTDAPPPWRPPVDPAPADSPEGRLARVVARRIRAMIADKEFLPSHGRPIRAGDTMVLVRRRGPFVEELVRTLKDLSVRVAGVDRMVITDQMAVMDLMALGRFVLLPEDDLTLATVLKSPLIGLDEDQLFHVCSGRGDREPVWRALRRRAERDGEPYASAYRSLADLLAIADAVPPFDFFSHVLGPLGGRRRLLARLGPDAEDPIAEFINLALAYERAHPPSLQGFLTWVETTAVEIKRDLEHGDRDAVRVLTVHGAKGLQAPIVILPDTMQVPRTTSRLVWTSDGDGGVPLWVAKVAMGEEVAGQARRRVEAKQLDEHRRLLYVAMTRAQDRLIVCGWATRKATPDGCWYRLIRAAFKNPSPGFDVETVDDPFLEGDGEADGSSVLRISCPQEEPKPEEAEPARATAEPLPAWATVPPADEPAPPRLLVPSRPDDAEPAVRSPLAADDGAGYRRGRLIHRLLQSLPELPPAERRRAAADWLALPAHGLAAAARAEIADEVLAVLNDPACADAFADGSRAEVPISGVVGDRVVAGQVDRLVVTPTTVTVVDYKTDRTPPADAAAVPAVYLRQMAAYRAALGAVWPDRRVRCVLLWTDGPRLMPLDDALLDAHDPLCIAAA
jgi:ATP-dependent helicase/nuclease subunit A